MTPPGTLTATEHRALDLIAELGDAFAEIAVDGPMRNADLAEVGTELHHLEARVLAQAGARAYPRRHRLLGGLAQPTAKGVDDLTDEQREELLKDDELDRVDDPRAQDRLRSQRKASE